MKRIFNDILSWWNIFWGNTQPEPPVSENTITLRYAHANPYIGMDILGAVQVSYTEGGVAKTQTFPTAEYPEDTYWEFYEHADPYTDIVITGDVQNLYISHEGYVGPTDSTIENHTTIEHIYANGCPLSWLFIRNNPNLIYYENTSNPNIVSLDLEGNVALETLDIRNCTNLQQLRLPTTTLAVSNIYASNCPQIFYIYAPCVTGVATLGIVQLITDSNFNNGTVAASSAHPSYYQISQAATTKGWTIIEP